MPMPDQVSHPAAETSESDAQNSMKAVMKIVAQLTQTYGQFDQSIANSATSLNTISKTAYVVSCANLLRGQQTQQLPASFIRQYVQ